MTSQSERDVDELIKRLEEKFDLSMRLTVVERDLIATTNAISVAFKSKKEHDDQNNRVRESLERALNECITEDEYTRRHEQLEGRLRDIERNMWKMVGGLIALWAVIQVAQHFAK